MLTRGPMLFENSSCVKCDVVDREMIRVGSVVMCVRCYHDEFKSNDPVRQERENYLKWMQASYAKADGDD